MKQIIIIFGLLFLFIIPNISAMEINFFEEFPDNDSLNKVCSLDFSFKLYLAAENLSEFYSWKDRINSCSKSIELIYWPTLTLKESYWISPWSSTDALNRIFNELKNRGNDFPIAVMLDLELPINKFQIWERREQTEESKRIISKFIKSAEDYNIELVLVEKSIPQWISTLMGLSYPNYKAKRIQMYYSSFRRDILPDFWVDIVLKNKIKKAVNQDLALGLGLIAPGIYGDEPTYNSEILAKELKMAQDLGMREVVIFRIQGLDEENLKIINKFVND